MNGVGFVRPLTMRSGPFGSRETMDLSRVNRLFRNRLSRTFLKLAPG